MPVQRRENAAPVTLDLTGRPRVQCSKCGKLGHDVAQCWVGDPKMKEAFLERRNAQRGGGAYRSGRGPGQKFGGGRYGGRGGRIRSPGSFAGPRDSVSIVWKVGAVRPDLESQLVVDTGAMGNLMIFARVEMILIYSFYYYSLQRNEIIEAV